MQLKNIFRFCQLSVPSIDLTRYLAQLPGWQQDCKTVSNLIQRHGLLYAKDPRVDYKKNDVFLDLMEKYFQKRDQQFKESGIKLDTCDQPIPFGLYYAFHQKHISYKQEKMSFKPKHTAISPIFPTTDPGYRFHWVYKSPKNIVPSDFPSFGDKMNDWSGSLLNTGITIAQMTAIGLGLPKNILSNYIINGPTYLSPPAVDLQTLKTNDVIGAFHRDFDLFTVHGKCRYAGLYAWLLTGQRFPVNVPDSHFLVQGGKQLEWITGGYLKAGFHEVIYTARVEQQKQWAKRNGKSTWRVASTTFCHVTGNMSIKPLQQFRSSQVDQKYPDLTADEYILNQLKLCITQNS